MNHIHLPNDHTRKVLEAAMPDLLIVDLVVYGEQSQLDYATVLVSLANRPPTFEYRLATEIFGCKLENNGVLNTPKHVVDILNKVGSLPGENIDKEHTCLVCVNTNSKLMDLIKEVPEFNIGVRKTMDVAIFTGTKSAMEWVQGVLEAIGIQVTYTGPYYIDTYYELWDKDIKTATYPIDQFGTAIVLGPKTRGKTS